MNNKEQKNNTYYMPFGMSIGALIDGQNRKKDAENDEDNK